MDTSAGTTSQGQIPTTLGGLPLAAAAAGRTPATRRTFVLKRAAILALAVMASTAVLHPSATLADVSAGAGYAMETVYCNSVTHTISITTNSSGAETGGITGNLFLAPETYSVWLHVMEFVGGAWHQIGASWVQVGDGGNVYSFTAQAGQTSYWYFTWAFQTASGWMYGNEWANGHAPSGWYSDQNGYHSLTSCRT